ncbi:hypothetical protein BKA62DRAFT_682974 [Auriculariales sp. MPI-PUGE-AT-0066]|nr:hypothetical protein BKA62DRAFT_682974 [Auriculariales sp. MPI-PUGE-AT-0066]
MSSTAPTARTAPFYVDAPFVPLHTITPDPRAPNQVWYFEGVSSETGSRASVQIVFMAGAPMGAPPAPLAFCVFVTGTTHDGEYFETVLPAVQGAEIIPGKGNWKGAATWQRAIDDKNWVVRFGQGTSTTGSLTLVARTPIASLHHPTEDFGRSLFDHELPAPMLANNGMGWSTAVPGADVTFDCVIKGKELKFTGTGFHDTNFGTSQWSDHISQWFWVRGAVGDLTFTVYHYLPVGRDSWHSGGAVWKDGVTLANTWTGAAEWKNDSIEVTPVGPWPEVPQSLQEPDASTLGLRVRVGDTKFEVTSTKLVAVSTRLPYGRWIATTKAVDRETEETGTASFDWFVFH